MPFGGDIGPTAYYTGQVWLRNGLSHPLLATREGRLLFDALEPVMRTSRLLGGPSLEPYLLARHHALDARLRHAIEHGEITHVVEIAAGMSPRGWRFAERYRDDLVYVETDLPAMAARKRRALQRIGSLSDHHRVVELDALAADGAGSLSELTAQLQPAGGLAVLTEGLLSYLPRDAVAGLWTRVARALSGFPAGIYLSDLHLGADDGSAVQAFTVALSAFVRGRVSVHYADAAQAEDAVRAAGFAHASVMAVGERANILEATTA